MSWACFKPAATSSKYPSDNRICSAIFLSVTYTPVPYVLASSVIKINPAWVRSEIRNGPVIFPSWLQGNIRGRAMQVKSTGFPYFSDIMCACCDSSVWYSACSCLDRGVFRACQRLRRLRPLPKKASHHQKGLWRFVKDLAHYP